MCVDERCFTIIIIIIDMCVHCYGVTDVFVAKLSLILLRCCDVTYVCVTVISLMCVCCCDVTDVCVAVTSLMSVLL